MNGPMPAIFLKGAFGFEPHDRGANRDSDRLM
jgi:hypothetical protein